MCLSSTSKSAGSSSDGEDNRRALEMEGKSILQLLFWNKFDAIKIAETKLEHK